MRYGTLLVLALLAPIGAIAEIPYTPIEEDSVFGRVPANEQQLWANMLAHLIRKNGMKCDTVGSIVAVKPYVEYSVGCDRLTRFYTVHPSEKRVAEE